MSVADPEGKPVADPEGEAHGSWSSISAQNKG